MEQEHISTLIRRWRAKRGLSLSQMAGRAGTSPSALSRYEKGWQRFEIYSLRKIASALNCRLYIDFIPSDEPKGSYSKKYRWNRLKRLFWDKKLIKSDLSAYPEWAVKRILEYGDMNDIKFMIDFFSREKFLDLVSRIKFSSKKARVFWQNILEKENNPCMKKPLQNRENKYWPI